MRTHAVLVIGSYELLGNQSTNSLSHPDPHYWLKDLDNLRNIAESGAKHNKSI
jgi:hypothetical protein